MKFHGNKTSDELEAEYLYFRLYNSYLLRTPDLRSNYVMLLDLWQKNPKSLRILSKNDLLRLQRVQSDIQNERYSLFSEGLNLSDPVPESLKTEKSQGLHRDLCMEILKRKELLEPFIGPIDYVNGEHPVKFGLIDILAVSGDTAYIIEVKTDSATHAIAGQVTKYFVGLSLTLSRKWVDDIKIITVCPGYDRVSQLQLGQIGAKCLVFSGYNPLEIKALG